MLQVMADGREAAEVLQGADPRHQGRPVDAHERESLRVDVDDRGAAEGVREGLSRPLAGGALGDDPGAPRQLEERGADGVAVLVPVAHQLAHAPRGAGRPEGMPAVVHERGRIDVGAHAARDDDLLAGDVDRVRRRRG